tara:strand:+ start:511 stop:945 length:435 start_codon:yes stop_codon:yes gene_type:complete
MNTKQLILNKLKNARKESLSKKVELSLLDDFSFGQYNELEEQVSALSYNVNEWFPEKFDQWYDIGRDIYAIYFQNAEPFPTETDFNNDLEIIEEIYRKSEELGISADTIYPSIEEHKRLCEEGQVLLAEFASQGEEFLRESKSV